jgi:hypothetical protein
LFCALASTPLAAAGSASSFSTSPDWRRNITGARPERSVNLSTRLCFQSLTWAAGNQPSLRPSVAAPTRSHGLPSTSLR